MNVVSGRLQAVERVESFGFDVLPDPTRHHVGEGDCGLGSPEADGPDDKIHAMLLFGEDMLARGAFPKPGEAYLQAAQSRTGATSKRGERS